jgi:hypothetical protein
VADDLFDIKPVADGIYTAIAKPAYKVNYNAAIIILDDGVLVVDTCTGLGLSVASIKSTPETRNHEADL